MEREHAEDVAGRLLAAEGKRPQDDPEGFEIERRNFSVSFVSLLPDFDDGPRPLEVIEPETGEKRIVLFGFADNLLWVTRVDRVQGPPKVATRRYGAINWGIRTVSDTFEVEDGVRLLIRAWTVRLTADDVTFTTRQPESAAPSKDEQFARALAARDGWDVGDVIYPTVFP